MNIEELNQYRDRLLETQNRLRAEIAQISAGVQSVSREAGGHDNGEQEFLANELVLESTESSLEQAVAAALARVEAGTYGQCQDCGGPIAKARLEAIPQTAFCIRCERKHESTG